VRIEIRKKKRERGREKTLVALGQLVGLHPRRVMEGKKEKKGEKKK